MRVFSGEPDMAEPGTDSVEVDPQASVITYSSADSDKFQSSCTDGYRPGGGNRKGHHTSRILHTMRGTRPTLPGRRNALRGCNQAPGQGNQSLKSKSRHTGSGFHEATGTEPFRKHPERKNCCRLPGNRNPVVADCSGFQTVGRRSNPKQIACFPSKHFATQQGMLVRTRTAR